MNLFQGESLRKNLLTSFYGEDLSRLSSVINSSSSIKESSNDISNTSEISSIKNFSNQSVHSKGERYTMNLEEVQVFYSEL